MVRSVGMLALVVAVCGCTAQPALPSASPAPTDPPTAVPSTPPPPHTSPPVSSPTSPPTPSQTTSTPTPTLTPTAPINAPELVLDRADIERHLDALARIARQNGGNRAPASAGYDAAADYVADELAALGYVVERHTVEFTSFRETAPVELTIGDTTWSGSDWLHANIYSASADVAGVVQAVGMSDGEDFGGGGCLPSDWQRFGPGRIALVPGGGCLRRDVVELAQDAGAAAVISMYPDWTRGRVLQPTLIDPSGIDIAAVVAGDEPSQALLDAAQRNATIELRVAVETAPARDDNVVAELAGSGDQVLMLGGHLDSVLDGPGMNDNGSGAATLLALAEALSSGPEPDLTVRFAFWAVEEFGTHGSAAYVDALPAAERAAITAYLNLDMVGSHLPDRFVYAGDSDSSEITSMLVDALEARGVEGVPLDLGGGSDHGPFQSAGIATGGVFAGVDDCYHLPCDDRENVDLSMVLDLGGAVLAVVEQLAY